MTTGSGLSDSIQTESMISGPPDAVVIRRLMVWPAFAALSPLLAAVYRTGTMLSLVTARLFRFVVVPTMLLVPVIVPPQVTIQPPDAPACPTRAKQIGSPL